MHAMYFLNLTGRWSQRSVTNYCILGFFSVYEVVLVLAGAELRVGLEFWICADHSIDNIKMFLLLLSRAFPKLTAFCFWYCHTSEETGRGLGDWEETQDRRAKLTKGIIQTTWHHAQNIGGG